MKQTFKLSALISALLLVAACETPKDGSHSHGADGMNDAAVGYDEYGNPITAEQQEIQNTGDRVFFATDSSVITSEGQLTLQRQAALLNQQPNINVIIEGHCDERGTREYNIALGERRANAAKNYLVSLGVDSSRVSTTSFGKERPAVLGSNQNAWAQNRRAVTVVR